MKVPSVERVGAALVVLSRVVVSRVVVSITVVLVSIVPVVEGGCAVLVSTAIVVD